MRAVQLPYLAHELVDALIPDAGTFPSRTACVRPLARVRKLQTNTSSVQVNTRINVIRP
jgi:hypothetical protein